MFALAKACSSRAVALKSILPRLVQQSPPKSAALLTIGDKLHGKEKIEEDRFIREQEKKYFEKKKAALEAQLHDKELKEFKDTVAPSMAEAFNLLKKTGDTVSEDGLEALAKWKLGK